MTNSYSSHSRCQCLLTSRMATYGVRNMLFYLLSAPAVNNLVKGRVPAVSVAVNSSEPQSILSKHHPPSQSILSKHHPPSQSLLSVNSVSSLAGNGQYSPGSLTCTWQSMSPGSLMMRLEVMQSTCVLRGGEVPMSWRACNRGGGSQITCSNWTKIARKTQDNEEFFFFSSAILFSIALFCCEIRRALHF